MIVHSTRCAHFVILLKYLFLGEPVLFSRYAIFKKYSWMNCSAKREFFFKDVFFGVFETIERKFITDFLYSFFWFYIMHITKDVRAYTIELDTYRCNFITVFNNETLVYVPFFLREKVCTRVHTCVILRFPEITGLHHFLACFL